LLVDCAVVVVENVEHRLRVDHKIDLKTRMQLTLDAASEVALPLVSGVVIIITVFLPLLALQGLEGRLFRPVAITIAFALAAALILSMTVIPALSAYLLKPGAAHEPWLVRKMHAVYDPLLARAMRNPLVVVAFLAVGVAGAIAAYQHIGQTFMPVMDEGTPVVSIRKYPTVSVDEAAHTICASSRN
jgi:cobalt-zinc-cadmium resistance protein CzcA